MTKRILILAYIFGVLLISGFASANTGRGLIVGATMHKTTTMMSVYGVFSNPCQTNPKIRAEQIDYQNKVVTLVVETTSTGDMCIEQLGGTFELSYDLRQLPLKPGVIYTVRLIPAAQNAVELSYLAQTSTTYQLYKELVNKGSVLVEVFSH